jgi:hypothetical protein
VNGEKIVVIALVITTTGLRLSVLLRRMAGKAPDEIADLHLASFV